MSGTLDESRKGVPTSGASIPAIRIWIVSSLRSGWNGMLPRLAMSGIGSYLWPLSEHSSTLAARSRMPECGRVGNYL